LRREEKLGNPIWDSVTGGRGAGRRAADLGKLTKANWGSKQR